MTSEHNRGPDQIFLSLFLRRSSLSFA